MNPVPEAATLETLFRIQLEKSTALRDVMSYYNRLDVSHQERNYEFLMSALKKHISKTRRDETRNELHQALSGGQGNLALLGGRGANPKGGRASRDQAGAGRGTPNKDTRVPKGHCRDWMRRGKCSKDDCSFMHDEAMKGRARSPTPSGRGRGKGRGRGRGKGQRSWSPSTSSSSS